MQHMSVTSTDVTYTHGQIKTMNQHYRYHRSPNSSPTAADSSLLAVVRNNAQLNVKTGEDNAIQEWYRARTACGGWQNEKLNSFEVDMLNKLKVRIVVSNKSSEAKNNMIDIYLSD